MSKKGRREREPALRSDRFLIYSLAAFLFAVPLFIWPDITEFGYGKSIIALIAISLLSILWGLGALQKRKWVIRLPWMIFSAVGILFAALLSLINATSGRVVIQSLILIVAFFQLILIIANVVRERRDAHLLLFSLLASGFLVSLIGLLQYLGVILGGEVEAAEHLDVVTSTMGNRNYMGGFLAYLLYPAVILVVRPRSRLLRTLAILLTGFCFGSVLLVQQAGTVVALIVAAVALMVGWLIFRPVSPIRKNRAWLLALLAVLTVTFLIQSPSGFLNSIVGLSADRQSWIGRIWAANAGKIRALDWWIGWEMFKEHPLTGVGLGNYKINFVPYKAVFFASSRGAEYDFYIQRASQAHSEYVQVAAEMGALGGVAVIGLILLSGISLWIRMRRKEDEEDRFDLLLLASGLVVFLAHSVVSFPAHLPASSLVVVLVAGLAFSPLYGEAAIGCLRLRRRTLRSTFAVVTLVGLAVCIIAGRDFAANILLTRGISELQSGQIPQAEATLERSLRLDFCARQTYLYLANVQSKLGKYEEAIETLEKCLTRFTDEIVYLAYAELAANLGQTDIARVTIRFLLATRPSWNTIEMARYAEAVAAAEDGQYEEAVRLLDQLAQDAPDFERSYIALGKLYRLRDMPVDARNNFEHALTLIEAELEEIERRMTSSTTPPVSEYRELRQIRQRLRQEKEYVLQELELLR